MPTRPARPTTRAAGARPARPVEPRPSEQQRSEDDPRIMLDREISADLYEPIPPYPTRTEREGEFYTRGDGRCSSTSARTTRPPTASFAWS